MAQNLLNDPHVPAACRALLRAERSAFLLGSIAADARVSSGLKRADTHFYRYDEPLRDRAWRVMLAAYPTLHPARSAAHRAFLAGYVAHLSMDEFWTEQMMRTHFVEREWGIDRNFRFFMLHILLIYMDERDYTRLESWQPADLRAAQPDQWLPFIGDYDLIAWRDFIAEQLSGASQTLTVFGERIRKTPADFRAVLDQPEQMQMHLWQHVSPALLADTESAMHQFAREQMVVYWQQS